MLAIYCFTAVLIRGNEAEGEKLIATHSTFEKNPKKFKDKFTNYKDLGPTTSYLSPRRHIRNPSSVR